MRPPLEFETFFRARYPALVRFLIMTESAGLHDAEDAAGEAMKAAYATWSTIGNPDAWTRQAALRALIAVRQRDRRRRHALLRLFAERIPDVLAGHPDLHDEVLRVAEMLNRLPPAQREIMAYRVDDFTPAEIAELVGKDPQTVRSNLRAARRALVAMLKWPPAGGG